MEKYMMNNITILIPDGESHLLRFVINGLARVGGIKICVMSSKRNSSLRFSRYIHRFSYYAKTDSDLGWIENINKEIEKHKIDFVMPIWEVGIKILAEHKDKVIFKNKLGLLPPLNQLNTARNKGLLPSHLQLHNIPGPKSVLVESINQLEKVDSLSFPVMIKPVEGFGGGYGIRKFNNKKDMEAYIIDKNIDYKLIVQEFIEGNDFGCNVLCKEGNILAFTMQKGNEPDEKQFAPSISWDFIYEPNLYSTIEKLMKSLNWSGVANIDLLYDKNDKQFKVLEINTRFWGSLDGSLLAGVNFPYFYYLASRNIDFMTPEYKHINYLSTNGVFNRIKHNKMFLFETRLILNNSQIKFMLKDPLPTVFKLLSKE
jgi:D-aspartate ligase